MQIFTENMVGLLEYAIARKRVQEKIQGMKLESCELQAWHGYLSDIESGERLIVLLDNDRTRTTAKAEDWWPEDKPTPF